MKRILTHKALIAAIAMLSAGPAWAAWNFVHITDIHVDTTNGDPAGTSFGNMMTKIKSLSPAPAFVIASGDLVDHGMTGFWSTKVDSANWRCLTRKMYKNGNTWYAKRTGTSPTYTYSIPIYFTPGNHDDRVDNVPTNIYPGESLNGYDQFIGYNNSSKPVSPTGVTCTFGSGDASRDYWFTYNNALVVSMYSGTDDGTNSANPNSAGLKLAQLTFLSSALSTNASKTPKIIFLHHPAHSAPGTLVTGEPYNDYVNGGNYSNYQSNFDDTLVKYKAVVSGTTYYPVVFQGHVEQNVVCDRSSWIQLDANWTGGTRYVQTAACKDGAYRIVTMADANLNFASVGVPLVNPTIPSVRITNPVGGTVAPGNALLTVDVESWDANKTNKVEISVNGKLTQTLTNLPYATNIVVPEATGNCVITAKAYDMLGNTNTASVTINGGVSTYYDRLNVGSTVYVNDPKCKGVMSVKLNDIRINSSNGKRQADLTTTCTKCGSWSPLVDVELPYRVGTTGLFVYPARIFDGGGLRCADIMIAPYQYPTVDIVYPMPGQKTNICEVQLATNYSGKNVPWTSANSKPNTDGVFSNLSDRFIWDMSSGSGPRTLTVSLRDAFGTQVSKSVTVTYDPSISFYIYRGPFGASWKGKSITFTPRSTSGMNRVRCYYWDVSSDQHGEETAAHNHDEEVSIIARTIMSYPLSEAIPGGSTPVYVVDKNEYTSGTLNDGYYGDGIITWKEVYDRLAGMLGKDSNGKYRVWASASAYPNCSPADAIVDVLPPTVSIDAPSNNSIGAPNTSIPVYATAYDQSGIDRVEFIVDGVAKGTDYSAPYSCTWTTPAAIIYDKDYTITAKAYSKDGYTTTASSTATIKGTLNNPVVNGGFESHGGWVMSEWGPLFVSCSPPNASIVTYIFGCLYDGSSSLYQDNIVVPLNATVLRYSRSYSVDRYMGVRIWINNNCVESHSWYESSGWAENSIDVTSYRGKAITLKFELYKSDGQNRDKRFSSLYVDNVRIELAKSEVTNEKPAVNAIPFDTKLGLIAPNPFTGQASIDFQLARTSQTTIRVYNINGQVVKTLINECLQPGYRAVKWDGRDANGNKVAAGVYLYRMSAGDYTKTNKLIVLR